MRELRAVLHGVGTALVTIGLGTATNWTLAGGVFCLLAWHFVFHVAGRP